MRPAGIAAALALAALLAAGEVRAQQADDATPDLELLEYLGSWQEHDEEWLVVAEWQKRERRPRRDPPPENADEDEDE